MGIIAIVSRQPLIAALSVEKHAAAFVRRALKDRIGYLHAQMGKRLILMPYDLLQMLQYRVDIRSDDVLLASAEVCDLMAEANIVYILFVRESNLHGSQVIRIHVNLL